jgi:6-pyruvoyltetrahydropterin/6-carboxytetrahydropterin synthase
MFTVSVMERFAAAHRLEGLDEGLHGHTYAVWVSIAQPKLDSVGIAYDFRSLKQTLHTIVSKLDHQYLNELNFFSGKNPTAENIAVYIYEAMKRALPEPAVQSVEVAESDTAKVKYEKNGSES